MVTLYVVGWLFCGLGVAAGDALLAYYKAENELSDGRSKGKATALFFLSLVLGPISPLIAGIACAVLLPVIFGIWAYRVFRKGLSAA